MTMMSMWWSSNAVSMALCVATGVRMVHSRAVSLTKPPALRHARDQVVRLITVVAGH
jgi:hypothetical protein